ncbi:hypothetical protein [Streptomyces cellulosae]|uniref:Secreted protein n=1 Tax=Streptomyces cellulosae TaxID=1968 RepID=A0ABW7Y2H3_STRCE
MRKAAMASMVAVAMGSFVTFGAGAAFAGGPGGATATGGSGEGDLYQQNIAQEGRQNSACDESNRNSIELTEGRLTGRCVNVDGSFNKASGVRYKGAEAVGGSTESTLEQQNVAQRGRQNNACDDTIDLDLDLDDGDTTSECVNKDRSHNEETLVKSGGAHAEGGDATDSLYQQNIAQEGRQNNACADGVDADFDVSGGGEASRCGNDDVSKNKHVLVKGGGARAEGGGNPGFTQQQNVAQEGRQNNACAAGTYWNPDVTDSDADSGCNNKDASRNKEVLIKSGGASAEGGSGDGSDFWQQNIAQEGRQNNACANLNQPEDSPDLTDSEADLSCGNKDWSRNKKVLDKRGGAHVEGGSGLGEVNQQNIAQEGRQNNACTNLNMPEITLTDSTVESHCTAADGSKNVRTKEIGGGADVEGGDATADLFQQNIAQDGRQNNACDNHNDLDATLDDGRQATDCLTVDRSVNKDTKSVSGGATVEGGDATADLFQQNIAQEGRQNNACGNSNELTLTGTGGRTDAQCVAVDRSVNIGSQGN